MTKKKKTNLEMLCWGIQHIAENHGFHANVNYEEDGEVCIYGGCNVPTLSDVQMLCEDVGIDKSFIESGECGIDVFIPADWYETKANQPYKAGLGLWRRYGTIKNGKDTHYSKKAS